MDEVIGTEVYAEWLEALRHMDYPRCVRIADEQIACNSGQVRRFWEEKREALGRRVKSLSGLDDTAPHWEQLNKRLQSTEDLATRRETLSLAINVCAIAETFDALPAALAAMGFPLRQLAVGWRYWSSRYIMHRLRRRWQRAADALTRAIDALEALSPVELRPNRGYLYFFHTDRALMRLHCGDLTGPEADIEYAQAMEVQYPPGYLYQLDMALATGELAFRRGRMRDALAAMQRGRTRHAASQYKRSWTIREVDMELLAARIARAEGNMEGFHYYCDRAMAMCTERKLPLSAAHVRAVRDGAPE